jgi:hypothetical protein
LFVVGDEQYLIQLNSPAIGYLKTLDVDGLPRAYLVLLAAGFNNRVNLLTS